MSNVVKFPKGRAHAPASNCKAEGKTPLPGRKRCAACQALWAAFRVSLFLVLYWLRMPLVLVCSVVTLPMFLLAVFAWYAFPEKPQMFGSFGAVSFTAFVILYGYDLLLAWLLPQKMVRML